MKFLLAMGAVAGALIPVGSEAASYCTCEVVTVVVLNTCAQADVGFVINYNNSWTGLCTEGCTPPEDDTQCTNDSIVTMTAGAGLFITGGAAPQCVATKVFQCPVYMCGSTQEQDYEVHTANHCNAGNKKCSFRVVCKCTICYNA